MSKYLVRDTGSGTCICIDGIAIHSCPQHGWDFGFFGPEGPRIDMGNGIREQQRGIPYKETGAPVASGKAGQVRKISSGRKKYRGMSSDGVKAR